MRSTDVNDLGGFDLNFTIPTAANSGLCQHLSHHQRRRPGLVGTEYYHAFQIQEFRRPEFAGRRELKAKAPTLWVTAPKLPSTPATLPVARCPTPKPLGMSQPHLAPIHPPTGPNLPLASGFRGGSTTMSRNATSSAYYLCEQDRCIGHPLSEHGLSSQQRHTAPVECQRRCRGDGCQPPSVVILAPVCSSTRPVSMLACAARAPLSKKVTRWRSRRLSPTSTATPSKTVPSP